MSVSTERKVLLGFGVALAILLVIGFVFRFNTFLGGVLATGVLTALFSFVRREIAVWRRAEAALRESQARVQEALQESERRYRELVESTQDMMGIHDLEGKILSANRAFVRILGFDRTEDVVGHNMSEFIAPDVREEFPQYLEKIQREGQARGLMKIVTRFGEARILEYDNSLRRDGPGGAVVRAVAHDITERWRVDKKAKKAQDELVNSHRELEMRATEITRLSKMSELLQSCHGVDEACRVLTYSIQQMFPAASGMLGILTSSCDAVEAHAVWGSTPGERVFQPDDCLALRRGQVHCNSNAAHSLVCTHLAPAKAAASICVPLMAQGETLGVFSLLFPAPVSPESQRELPDSTVRLAVAVAEQTALSLANLRLRETLRNQSIRDPLTGLFNRRYLEHSLDRELRRATRSKRPLALLMLDLDHFKRFNDTFGHDAGDTLLRELANFLLSQIRGEDIACRFGGEEFALILPEASLDSAHQRAEHLRNTIHKLQVHHRKQALGSVTLSIGVAVFPTHGKTADDLIRAADQALYRAKHEGRDRVVLAGTPPS